MVQELSGNVCAFFIGNARPEPKVNVVTEEGVVPLPIPKGWDLRAPGPVKFTTDPERGYGWGYIGSIPAQTAFAILAFTFDIATAFRWYKPFMLEVLCHAYREQSFAMELEFVRQWVGSKYEVVEGDEERQRIQDNSRN